MKVAIVTDWLPTFGGAEHVIWECARIWPNATIYTTIANRKKIGPLNNRTIVTSWLQLPYSILKNHQLLLPFMPKVVEGFDVQHADVVLSSSHAVAKGVVPPSTAVHVCYCHTPMRYAWEMEQQYLQDFNVPSFLQKRVKKLLRNLRRWDLTTAKRVDVFVANSSVVQERIKRIYGRDSVVVHPPVDDAFFQGPVSSDSGSYFLAVGRLVPYKRFELLIEAANALQIPLKIAGTGQEFDQLKKLAGPTVEMLGFVEESKLQELYSHASALLFPQYEDAGVVALEAQATGTPVIAYKKGGALDAIEEGKTGIFFEEQTIESMKAAIETFNTTTFDRQYIRDHAAKFSVETFASNMTQIVEDARSKYCRN